ncbi:hypothetical protein [Agrobacterium larrymoorei]|uniref:Uncharacterized protein n=1 Tax=Agrobacterium larrymoorei TaxID=160699 RepID=A0AAF0H8H4_9HYPH|nr:hypothetical protein [Agrobacterium larrymoorei]WHA40942.1 hypothetical protein CFBP5477_014200 [Agrobacterium larrymoorei]
MLNHTRSKSGSKLPPGDALKKLIRQGFGRNQIAERYSVTPSRVRERLKELGLNAPVNGKPKPDFQISTMTLETPEGLISLPRVSMIASMEKYA